MISDSSVTRRAFLKRTTRTAAAGVVAGAATSFAAGQVRGANDRFNLAVIGIRSQGFGHIRGFSALPNVRIKTLCDIDENLFPERVKFQIGRAHV